MWFESLKKGAQQKKDKLDVVHQGPSALHPQSSLASHSRDFFWDSLRPRDDARGRFCVAAPRPDLRGRAGVFCRLGHLEVGGAIARPIYTSYKPNITWPRPPERVVNGV